MWAVFSLHVGVIFPCVRGGGGWVSFLQGGERGGGWIIGLAPHNNFCESLLLSHFLLHRFYNLSRSWRFEFFERVIRSTKKTSPVAPPPPAPTKINNFCPLPSHGQHFRFSHYYHYPITHTPGTACSLRNNINLLKSRPKNKFPQKIETSTIWKKINICDVKKMWQQYGLPQKNCQGGGARPKIPPKTYGKRDPPHGENGLYVERNDSAHIEKIPS